MNASSADAPDVVGALLARARAAQHEFETWSQERVDEAVTAAAWAIVEPGRNRALAEIAVRDTGLGNVADKIAKNRARRSVCCATCAVRSRWASSARTASAA
jgi:sulfoacetaldehyde dehydrogenase